MKQYKVCFWLNAPSAHQSEFLDKLYTDKHIEELEVRYFDNQSEDYAKLGWGDDTSLKKYEQKINTLSEALKSLTNFEDFIHIVMGESLEFNKKLIRYLVEKELKWIHWSERFGVSLIDKLSYNLFLFKYIKPIYLLTKKRYGALVDKYALGAFSQGNLARNDFKQIGISDNKIENLFYTTKQPIVSLRSKNSNEGKINFLYIGRLNKRKGIYDLLKSFYSLTKYNNWSLTLIGDDESNGIITKVIKKVKLKDRITLINCVQHSEVLNYMINSDVLILPSRFDGWGAVLNEAISVDLPIISTNQTGAAQHIIKNQENGFIVEAGNIKQLTQAIKTYLKNPLLINEHSKVSSVLKNEFTPRKNIDRFIEALNKWTQTK